MTEMVECPVEGCDYGPKPKTSVLGHYSGKSDGRHPGGYQKAKDLLEPGSATQPEPEPSSEPAESTSASGSAGGSDSNPVFGSAEPTAEPEPAERRQERQARRQQQQQTSPQMSKSGEDPVCIRCGGELYDFRAFETGRYHSINNSRVWVRGDYQCSSCGMWLQEDED